MARDGPSTRALLRILVTATLFAVVVYGLYSIRRVLLLLATAAFLAVTLGPAVDALQRRRLPRPLCILAVYAALVGAVFGIGLLFVPPLSSGVRSMADDAPRYVDELRHSRAFRDYDNRYGITDKLKEQAGALPGRLAKAATTLSSVTVGVFSALVQLVTVLTLAFFLLLDGRRYVDWCLSQLAPERAERTRTVVERIYRSVAGAVAGNLAISLIAGLVSFVTLTALGVPFALPLSVLMAFFDLIPLVGATIGAVIVGVVTLFHGFPESTLIWAAVQIVYQQVEGNVIFPVVYRRTVQVSGPVTIVAVLIGATLLGVLGALLAIPVAAAVQIVVTEVWRARGPPLSLGGS